MYWALQPDGKGGFRWAISAWPPGQMRMRWILSLDAAGSLVWVMVTDWDE
jgi:hypothetical protein